MLVTAIRCCQQCLPNIMLVTVLAILVNNIHYLYKQNTRLTSYTAFYRLSSNTPVDDMSGTNIPKSSPTFTLIGIFPGHELDRFMENSSNQNKLVKFCPNSGYELERFLENLSNRNFSIFGYDTGRFLENLGVA